MDTFADKPLVWMRLIDDIFFVWTHGEDSLKLFIDHLNSSHDTIKFTSKHSTEPISFLDLTVKVGEGGVLMTDLFCKPTDTHQFLIRNLVALGIQRRRFPIVMLLGIVGFAQMTAGLRNT